MAGLSPWALACIAVLPALGVPLMLCARGKVASRFVASQLATSVGLLILVMMTFAFDQPSSIDLAVALGLLALPSTLLFAVVLERWL